MDAPKLRFTRKRTGIGRVVSAQARATRRRVEQDVEGVSTIMQQFADQHVMQEQQDKDGREDLHDLMNKEGHTSLPVRMADLPTTAQADELSTRILRRVAVDGTGGGSVLSTNPNEHIGLFARRLAIDGHGLYREGVSHLTIQSKLPSGPFGFLTPSLQKMVREMQTFIQLSDLAAVTIPTFPSQLPKHARSGIIGNTKLGALCRMITEKVPSSRIIGSRFANYKPDNSQIKPVLHAFIMFSIDPNGTFGWCLFCPIAVEVVHEGVEIPPYDHCTPLQLEGDQSFVLTARRPYYPFVVPCRCIIDECARREFLGELPAPPTRFKENLVHVRLPPDQIAPKESLYGLPDLDESERSALP